MSATETLHTEALDRHRRRRFQPDPPAELGPIPAEWRTLLTRWLRRGGNSRWETLKKDAGKSNLVMADQLLEWLLKQGWISVTEERELAEWWPKSVEFRNLPALRGALGLSDQEQERLRWQVVREALSGDEELRPALLTLDEMPVARALLRAEILAALQRWQAAQHSGTRRDFALAARGDTKGISEAEWNWLEQALDLSAFRIERHTPLLLLAAPLTLHLPEGTLSLGCSDFAALTPATLLHTGAVSGAVSSWQLLENRTSFERVARQRQPNVGVIWLPGYPPGWWCQAVSRLLDLAPAAAQIACDPDPAGIHIALKAAELWQSRHLDWRPWKMDATDLACLRVHKPLNETDRQQLAVLQDTALPAALRELAAWMREHEQKGEQEGMI